MTVDVNMPALPGEETRQEATTDARRNMPALLSLGLLAAGLAIWWISFRTVDPADLTDYGLIATLPAGYWAAVGALALGFTISLGGRTVRGAIPYLHLLGLVVVLHVTPELAYGTLRYSWAWKHIGIIDYIQRHGTVDPVAPFLPAYHNWPGFFYFFAIVANRLGLSPLDLASYARFSPAVLNALYVLALIPVYRRLTDDPRRVAAAIWLFLVGNWIGQDYFSPQGISLLFYLLIMGLCLAGFAGGQGTGKPHANRATQLLASARTLLQGAASFPPQQHGLLANVAGGLLVLILILMTTATHQLTPLAIILMLAALVVMGRVSPYVLMFAFAAELLWLLYFAAPFVVFNIAEELSTFGEGLGAVEKKMAVVLAVSEGRAWGMIIGRALTLGVLAFAMLGGFRRWRLGYRDGLAAAILFSALPLMANRYGGEIHFRVYLFALPMLALFAAAAFFPTVGRGAGRISLAAFGITAVLGVIGFLFANNGKDREYTFTRDEVDAAAWLYGQAPPNSLLIEGARNYPSQFMNYENFAYLPISEENRNVRNALIAAPEQTLSRWLSDEKWKAGYIIITRSQKALTDAEGVMPPASLDGIEIRLMNSAQFEVVYSSPNTKIFMLHAAASHMGPWSAVKPLPEDPAAAPAPPPQ